MIPSQEMYNTLEVVLQEAVKKLVDRVIDLAERTVIDALETCSVDLY